MGLSINTNELTLGAERNLDISQQKFDTTIKRLSSGNRIIQASDDPAGLAISDNLNAQIRSLGQAIRNAQDGASLAQVFEGGANNISNALIRIRELAMQSATDTVDDTERGMLNNEARELVSEISRIAKTTKFAGVRVLSGEKAELEFQIGINNDPDIDRIKFAPGNSNLTAEGLEVQDVTVDNKEGAQAALNNIDEAINHVNSVRAKIGSTQARLNTTVQAQQIFTENLTSARSRIADADVVKESAELAKQSILRKAGVAVLSQANETPALLLQLLR
jgi:flagellin